VNLAQVDKLTAKAARIRAAMELVQSARNLLTNFNTKTKGKPTLPTVVVVFAGDRYGNGEETMNATVPTGVIQQQLVYAVMAAERALVAAQASPL
jgi:hypothetical protein